MEIKYNLGNYSREEAYEKIDKFLDGLVSQHSDMISNPEKEWNAKKDNMKFSFKAKGYDIKGDISLQGKELILNGELPGIATLFSGKIKKIINKNLDELFVKE